MADDFLAAQVQADATAQADPNDPNTWGGDGYPNAPDEVKNALKELVFKYEIENSLARLGQVRDILLHREFFAGRQVTFWSATDNRYRVPTAAELDVSEEEYADLLLTTNIYRGFILIIMAELSQSPPRTAFTPQRATVLQDVKLAKDANHITSYINRCNRIDERLAYAVWLLCTDASFAEYWRFVRDPKFGVEDYQVQDGEKEIELAPDRAECPECGESQAVESAEMAPGTCPGCGAMMGPQSFKPRETATVPNMVTKQRPAGREVCDVVGMLEMVIPAYEKDEEELGFLTWCREVHKSKLQAIFPHAADAIAGSGVTEQTTSTNERIARLSLLTGWRHVTDAQTNLATFRESWFRPWAFEALREKYGDLREKFYSWFPNGVKVAFAGEVYCGAWQEALQEHWTICHAMPGDGQYRGAVAADAIAGQRKYNKLDSIEMETHERALPFYAADTDVWDVNALGGRTEASAVYGVRGTGNKTASNSIYNSPPLTVSEQLVRKEQDLRGPIMEHLTGAYAPLYGGDTGGNDTAHGIAIERNAAKGRLGLIYRALKNFRARCDKKNLKLFVENRTQDVEIAVAGPGSEYDAIQIHLADIKGGSVEIEANADESFPVALNEQRQVISTLVNNANPTVMGWFSEIANAEQLVELLGVDELVKIPGADARRKMFDIISLLVKAAPMPPPMPPPMVDPASGLAMPPPPPGPPEPSIQPDPVLDNLPVFVKAGQEWSASPAGCKEQMENPPGYANVQAFVAKCQMLMAPPPMPIGPPPPNQQGPVGGRQELPNPPESSPTGPLPVGPM